MRMRVIAATAAALGLSLTGLVAVNPASAQESFPSACLTYTDNAGQGLSLQGDGHGNQPFLEAHSGDCLTPINEETISGVTYFQLEDHDGGFCLNEALAPKVVEESCPVDSSNELIRLAGTNGNELEFKADSEYVTTASVAGSQQLEQSSSATPTSENQWEWSNDAPVEQVLPVDFVGPTSSDWTTIGATAPAGEIENVILEICDPLGNCGGNATEANTSWDSTLQTLRSDDGVRPLYYISTGFADIPLATVEQEAAKAETWYGSYGIGFMFDEVSGTSADQSYYQDLYDYATEPASEGGLGAPVVMMNAGAPPSVDYVFGDQEILQVFEGSETDFTNGSFSMPSWADNLPTSAFAATISDATASSYTTALTDAEHDGIGNIYIDDEAASPPPYDTLPSFLAGEAAAAASYDPGTSAGSVGVP
jgi:Spherulation-specific family 4